jgi:hypothetical protein
MGFLDKLKQKYYSPLDKMLPKVCYVIVEYQDIVCGIVMYLGRK